MGEDTTTADEAYRLLFAWGEARAKCQLARNKAEQAAANDACHVALDAMAEAADGLWIEWLAEQSR